ncbi:MAG: DNA translocase FtsK 4TM domain-containing protein [Hyphomicrobiaceae bacterium]
MDVERVGAQSRPLLPEDLSGRVIGLFCRAAGLAFGLVAAAGWLSLLTWSAEDPSLTHAATGQTRNLLGPIGAIFSDLLLQALGFAAVLVFLGLAFASGELLLRERLSRVKARTAFLIAAILVLAAALSSLPMPQSWPINHGLGGAVGDMIFNLAAGITSVALPGRGGALAGLLLFAGGMCLLSAALDINRDDWMMLTKTTLLTSRREAIVAPGLADARSLDRDHLPPQRREPAPQMPLPDFPPMPEAPMMGRGAGPRHGDGRDMPFDDMTDAASRSIARRFAPQNGDIAAPAKQAAQPPPPQVPAPTPRAPASLLGGLNPFRGTGKDYRPPSLNLLKRPPQARPGPEHTQPVLRGNARLLEDVLGDFGVKGQVKDIKPGPVVTLFEMEPARGTKSSRVVALSDDIARSMSAVSARIAVVPGRNALGIELPNVRREMVFLRELLESEAWRTHDGQLPVALGKGIGGEPIIADLARMPHLLVAGTTGSGKSVGVNALILSLLYRLSPEECRLLLIDPKMLELSVYNGVPHLLAPVVTDPHKAAATLAWAVGEMEERYKRMAQLGVRNIEMFNVRAKNAKKRGEMLARTVQTGFDEATGEAVYVREDMAPEPMPFIVIVVDEFADLMAVAGKEVEGSVQRLAQMARAAGIHLIMATQRPSVDVVTGTIKANFPTRIAFKVASKIDSRTIIGEQGAEQLLGAGDMLYSAGSGLTTRVHGPFVADEEVESVVEKLKENGEPNFVDALLRDVEDATAAFGGGTSGGGSEASTTGADDLYDRAVAVVHRDGKASTSYLQRRLGIGYNRAADLIERMEADGIVSPADNVGRRRVLIGAGAESGGA